jgi:hypothetical protein
MKTISKLETLGVLLKEESLQTVENNVLENSLVLESIEPFPGYHGVNLPTGAKPDSLFLITERAYPLETIFRVSQHLCCSLNVQIDACPAEINIRSTTYSAIRIRDLSKYSLISEIQSCYLKKDIRFMKLRKINSPALIRLTKIFSLEKLDDHIFLDLDDENTFYLTVPYHFSWDAFQNVSPRIKNNLDNSNFDSALGYIFLKEMIEFVRIYAVQPEISRLKLIREKYVEEIARMRVDAM